MVVSDDKVSVALGSVVVGDNGPVDVGCSAKDGGLSATLHFTLHNQAIAVPGGFCPLL